MGAIHDFLAADHDRLDALLRRAGAAAAIDVQSYEGFRRGLLKHVGMEEQLLLPGARKAAGKAVALAERARLDHGALTGLLIPPPTRAILGALGTILKRHNEMEERLEGLYAQAEAALGAGAAELLGQLRTARDIPPAEHVDGPHVRRVIRGALDAAGYPGLL